MAALSQQEKLGRDIVKAIHSNVEPTSVRRLDRIRDEAIAQFAKSLDEKLANLQEGESLRITYRVDIMRPNGEIRGGKNSQRNMPEYIEWRTAVYERDKYTCVECGQIGGELNAHHILGWEHYPASRFDIDNGVTLCVDCHAKHHPHIKVFGNGA